MQPACAHTGWIMRSYALARVHRADYARSQASCRVAERSRCMLRRALVSHDASDYNRNNQKS